MQGGTPADGEIGEVVKEQIEDRINIHYIS